jgi:endonuclease/exonuclease/phosphatase family metal-dependent hydrolase
VRLLQLNTWSCKLAPEIVRLLDTTNPDVVTLQEVVSTVHDGKILDTIDSVFSEHPFSSRYYTPLVEFAFMHHQASRGNLIASNLPFVAQSQFWTHGTCATDFDYQDSGGYNIARNIAHVTHRLDDDTPLHILTLHGYHLKEHKLGNEETMRACKMLIEYISTLEGGIIVTGDFNLSPESESIHFINQSLRNLSVEYGLTTTRNHLTTKKEVCDYIFVNDQINVSAFSMSDMIVSDHNALSLDFTVTSNN